MKIFSMRLISLLIVIQTMSFSFGRLMHTSNNPGYFNIGGMLSKKASEAFFNETIDNLNFDSQYVNKGVTYRHVVIEMDSNPIRTALNVCKYLISKKVYAIIVSHPLEGELSPAAVSYTSGFYHIPVIGISSRDSAFSDKNIHVSFLRTVPPYSHQADVWVELLKYFNYMKVIFIHSSDTDGRSLLGRFQTTSQVFENDMEIKIQVEYVLEFEPGLNNFRNQLLELKNAQSRVYLLYAPTEDAEVIFQNAAYLNMTGAGYVWLVTEQALRSTNVPDGALGLKLVNVTDEKSHIRDSLYVLVSALREMNETENILEAPKDCDNTGSVWETGKKLFQYLKQQVLDIGATGRIAFDDNGDRIYAEYDVINVKGNKTLSSVGRYYYSSRRSRLLRFTLQEVESELQIPWSDMQDERKDVAPVRLPEGWKEQFRDFLSDRRAYRDRYDDTRRYPERRRRDEDDRFGYGRSRESRFDSPHRAYENEYRRPYSPPRGPRGTYGDAKSGRKSERDRGRGEERAPTSGVVEEVVGSSWNIPFSGGVKESPSRFLSRIEDFRRAFDATDADLMRGVPEVLSDEAVPWYESVWNYVYNWKEFEYEFKERFVGGLRDDDTHREFQTRTQAKNESIDNYLTDLRKIESFLQRPMREEALVELAYGGLLPEYHRYMNTLGIRALKDLEYWGRR